MEWYLLGNRVSDASPDRILITRNGSTFTIPLDNSSRYDGLTFYSQKGIQINPIKILDRIDVDEHSALEQVHVRTNEVIFVYESGLILRYSLKCAMNKTKSINALVVHSNKPITGTVWLDTRHPYDGGAFHKIYDIKETNEAQKKKNYSKNHSYDINFQKRGEHDNTYDIDIKYKMLFESANENANVERVEWWHSFHDEQDKVRGEKTHSHYAYAPFRFIDQHRIIIAEDNPNSFIESAPDTDIIEANMNDNSATLISMLSHNIKSVTYTNGKKNKSYGMMAGIPWFFQSWTRDTALSLHALRLIGNEDDYRGILTYLLKHVEKDEASIPEGTLKSIDAPLITIMRLHQAYNQLSSKEKNSARKTAIKILKRIQKDNVREELLWSNTLETWMDTGDLEFRKGACIEMQALLHRAYLFMEQTETKEAEKKKYRKLANELREKVEKEFNKNGIIYDHILENGQLSENITPNPFLAYYYSPTLFEKKVWEESFDKLYEELNSPNAPGLLASLSPTHHKFQPKHTGMNNISYHRGDSWYFVNCIAGIAMLEVNKKKYDSIIKEIYETAKKDCFELGAIGYCSEISSYEMQEAKGCYAQTWSAAMLLELHVKIAFSD